MPASAVRSSPSRATGARREVLRLAWPIVLANSAVPLLGIADAVVVGNTGTSADLGAIALGSLVFGFLYWSFGFLRMGTTGFTAQASGAGDDVEIRATLGRALLLAGGIGCTLVLLQVPIVRTAAVLLSGTAATEELMQSYFMIRIWGAPASLGIFALIGTLVGLGRTRQLLHIQFFLNGLNITLDILLAGVLGLGVQGIALGTAIAEWTTLGLALLSVFTILGRGVKSEQPFWPWDRMRDPRKTAHALGASADIMVRTLFLLGAFAWFTNVGAALGDDVLAANHVLLQLVTLSAYILDGYAHATEILVGRAIGSRHLPAFDRAVRAATELAALSAGILAVSLLLVGPLMLAGFTDLPPVREIAGRFLPLAAAYVAVSFAAFQLDGVFIGAVGTKDMRNASALAFLVFLGTSLVLTAALANLGLWAAFIVYVVARAAALAVRYPRLRSSIGGGVPAAPP